MRTWRYWPHPIPMLLIHATAKLRVPPEAAECLKIPADSSRETIEDRLGRLSIYMPDTAERLREAFEAAGYEPLELGAATKQAH